MIVHERAVKFEDIDAAGIVFFGKFLNYLHDGMEAFFGGLDGGYSGLINKRRVGFPAVDVHVSYQSPLRFGDVVLLEVETLRLGNHSTTFRQRLVRKSDGVRCAVAELTVVCTLLDEMRSCDMPPDVRALLKKHLIPPSPP